MARHDTATSAHGLNWNRNAESVPSRRTHRGYFYRAGRCEPPVGRARARALRARAPGRDPMEPRPTGATGQSCPNQHSLQHVRQPADRTIRIPSVPDRARLMTLALVSHYTLVGGSRSSNWGPRKLARARRIGIGEGGHVRGRGAGAASGAREPTDRHSTTAAGGPAGVQPVSARAVSHTHPSLRQKKLHGPAWRGTTNLWGGAPARAYRRPYTTPSAPAADIAALASAAVSCADSVATTPALATRRMSLCEYSLGSMPRCCILL